LGTGWEFVTPERTASAAAAARPDAGDRRAAHSEVLVSTLARRFGIGVIAGVLALIAGVKPASAQELSLGYQWQQLTFDVEDEFDLFTDDSLTLPFGINLDVAFPLTQSLDIFGQLDWSTRGEDVDLLGESLETSFNFTTFGAGIRWSGRTNPGVTPFVHGLFGLTHSSFGCEVTGIDCDDFFDDDNLSATDPMFQLGGGVAIPLGGVSALGQVDYRHIFAENAGVNGFRFVIGIRLGLR
jgi:hypothetical protein